MKYVLPILAGIAIATIPALAFLTLVFLFFR